MSPYEVAAREKKASAIALYMIPQIDFTRIDAVRALRSLSEAYRTEIARRAGQDEPSPRTWDRVVELVKQVEVEVTAARREIAQVETVPARTWRSEVEAKYSRRRGNGRSVPVGWAI